MAAYSFLDTTATITGPGGSFQLAYGAGAAEEGISWEMTEDKNKMMIGAGGEVMHSLHAGKSGTATARLLKTSAVNAMLMIMYDLQTASSGLHGANLILVTQKTSGDATSMRQCAFKRRPNMAYGKDAGTVDWSWDVGKIDGLLGTY